MIIDTWDLLDTETFSRFTANDRGEVGRLERMEHLRRILVIPRGETNRRPHLLDPERPDVGDLLDESGTIAGDIRERTWLLRELLLPRTTAEPPQWQEPPMRSANGRWDLFRSWFDAQRGILAESGSNMPSADCSILAIPDFLGVRVQEALLANAGFDRARTRLLWRPIAAVLGAEQTLQKAGVCDGDNIAVIDWAADDSYRDICILKMVRPNPSDWPGVAINNLNIIPCRRTIPEKPGPIAQSRAGYYEFVSQETRRWPPEKRFDLATRHKGFYELPSADGRWVRMSSSIRELLGKSIRNIGELIGGTNPAVHKAIATLIGQCRCVLSLGVPFHEDSPFPEDVPILREGGGENWVALGCARFAARDAAGLPTYYDEIQPLHAIGQDTHEEKIVSKELIPKKTKWPGGKPLKGKPYQAEIEATSGDVSKKPFADFRFHLGELTRQTHLSHYRHEFDIQLNKAVPISLYPIMVAGQGLARVEIRGVPGADAGTLFLKLENMELEKRQPKGGLFPVNVTMDLLEKEMDRSYPPDIPHVLPDAGQWADIYWNVIDYLETGIIDSGLFARASNANVAIQGNAKSAAVAALQRTNVFGSDIANADKSVIEQLFARLHADWKKYQTSGTMKPKTPEEDLVRLIAWTYNPEFGDVVDAVLDKAEKMAKSGNSGLYPQEYTLLANLVRTPKRQKRFMSSFAYQWQKYKDNPAERFKNWIRAASYVLMLNNDATAHLGNSENCRNLMKDFYITLGRFNADVPKNASATAKQYHKHLFRAMLFLLKRRRIDRDFIPTMEGVDWLMKKLPERLRETIDKYGAQSGIGIQANAVLQYLLGKGTLEGATIFND